MAQEMNAAWHEPCESAAILRAAAAALQTIEPDIGEIDGPPHHSRDRSDRRGRSEATVNPRPLEHRTRRPVAHAWAALGVLTTLLVGARGLALTALGQALRSLYLLRYVHEEELRGRMQLQINRGEGRHQLARRLFFANQGAFQTGDYEEIMNKATCLSLLSNAVLVWNTVHMTRVIAQLRANGETITPEELRRISPLAFSHVIPNGTYFTQHTTLEHDGDQHGHMSPVDVEVASDA
jgi:hypothetical protein